MCQSMEIVSTEPKMDLYREAIVFITGATGFVGKALLEKLLWSFPQIKRIYMLIRPKGGITAEQRFQNFLHNGIFERLRSSYPERLKKIAFFPGNIEDDNFGLNELDRLELCAQVNIIFHSAATVRFNECLKVAARVNSVATYNLLEMCKEMPQLKSFLYVSTAYCNPGRKYVDERIYPTLPPVDWLQFLTCTKKIPDEYLNRMADYIKGPHVNTYTFTKSIAEQIVNSYKDLIPIVIVRPSIVTAAYKEPYPGWIDNIQAISGIMMEIGKGGISSILGDKNLICDIIPVDFVVNAMIMMVHKAQLGSISICNATSGVTNPISWQRLGQLTMKWSRIYPTKRMIMFPNFKYRRSAFKHEVAVWLLHFVPAILMDLSTLVLKQKKRLVTPIASKFRQACLAGSFFSLNEWIFKNRSRYYFKDLIENGTFPMLYWNLDELNYDDYVRRHMIGINKYLHREKSTINANKMHVTRVYWFWIFAHIFFYMLIAYVLML
ncbi:putative fatty acyl-CoA reductase CG5065 [Drosophila sulfurigaster albostrigata]|uniref:putative fatty acyl-CoA reductase CG5065 n=1 Tax=Drosophila sulfurigaster albostrigata TaxID=89887 RepID=UPI002D21D9E2|nr:putative fatty acyl-CoA reductase CG5065 [Drosophila sulfurigaster albostrigata]